MLANTRLRSAPTAPAEQVYAGVLYGALGPATLDAAARARLHERARVCSALFGILRLTDHVPAYRLSAASRLPGLGTPGAYWRARLGAALDPQIPTGTLVIDCRSAAYAGMWRPDGAQVLPVRVFRDHGGARTVVSHLAKHARGLLARALCAAPGEPTTAAEAAQLADAYLAAADVRTAAGAPVTLRVEDAGATLDVIST